MAIGRRPRHSYEPQLIPRVFPPSEQPEGHGYGPGYDPDGKYAKEIPGIPAAAAPFDSAAALEELYPLLRHFLGAGRDGSGVNSGVLLTDGNPVQIGYPNPRRIALGVSIPSGATVYHGYTRQVSPNPGTPNAGTPVPSGSTWLYGTEWTGMVWIVGVAPFDIDVRILEISRPR
jgi:hypothetical protein